MLLNRNCFVYSAMLFFRPHNEIVQCLNRPVTFASTSALVSLLGDVIEEPCSCQGQPSDVLLDFCIVITSFCSMYFSAFSNEFVPIDDISSLRVSNGKLNVWLCCPVHEEVCDVL